MYYNVSIIFIYSLYSFYTIQKGKGNRNIKNCGDDISDRSKDRIIGDKET